jgi:selenide,water dikinase
MRASDLVEVLKSLPDIKCPELLVGIDTHDDAGVYRLTDDIALVQTVDFFTPVVDDPYWFGAIAAANAFSDVYAMGAKPLTALNISAFPSKTLPNEILCRILKGAQDKVTEADAVIVGGHTIDDKEPKFGMAVTGVVSPRRVVTNAGARPGDRLVLTKPLGVGIITTAIKGNVANARTTARATRSMAALNRTAAEVMVQVGASACTDITGFGLLGHLHQMLHASGISARLSLADIPVLPTARDLAAEGIAPGGAHANLDFYGKHVQWDAKSTEVDKLILADPQTSGGLLISVQEKKAEKLVKLLQIRRTLAAAMIGAVQEGRPGAIVVEP